MAAPRFLKFSGGHSSFWSLAAEFSVKHDTNGLLTDKNLWPNYHNMIARVLDDDKLRLSQFFAFGPGLWDLTIALDKVAEFDVRYA